jgi:transposase
MASVIKAIGLIDRINARLVPDAQAVLTPGEAMAGMILNGLGCANRPWSLTPQLFANQPRDRLCHAGIHASMFNRFPRGRRLDEAYTYGCDRWFQAVAQEVCAQEGLDLRCKHLDTTSVSLRGAYVPEHAEQAMSLTYGDSNDHRPDVKPAVLALMVFEDGGGPCGSKRWDGHTSDIAVFQERAQALMTAFQNAPSPRYLSADAKLSHEDHAPNLHHLGLMTRIPTTIGAVSQVIAPALTWDTWPRLDDNTRDQGRE